MPGDCLLDSNILLRMTKADDANYGVISKALRILSSQGARFCFTSQTVAELWNVSTRPLRNNGFGLSTQETEQTVRVIERDFLFLPDNQNVHERWRSLLTAYDVKGVQVHDARLAASMYVHHVQRMLTFNVGDFRRYQGLQILHPSDVGSATQG